jgi:hypothetical protein
VPALSPLLGTRWHVLDKQAGRVAISPSGRRSRYFSVGFIAWAPADPARIGIITRDNARAVGTIPEAGKPATITFGPLRTKSDPPIPSAIMSAQLTAAEAGPQILVSPIEAQYLQPGQAVPLPTAAQATGPEGLSGTAIVDGGSTDVDITPGVRGRVRVRVLAVALSGEPELRVSMAGRAEKSGVPPKPRLLQLGPFRSSRKLTIRVRGGNALVGDVRIAPF